MNYVCPRLMSITRFLEMINEVIRRKLKYAIILETQSSENSSLFTLQQLQGTLLVTLRDSVSNQLIDDGEVRRKFQQFGEVKSVRPVSDRNE